MTKNNSLFNLDQARNVKDETECDCSKGVTERLLRKYRSSKVLSLIDGKIRDTKKDIAA